MIVTSICQGGLLHVFINDIPHIVLEREKFLGFVATQHNSWYCITISMAGGDAIFIEYDTRDKWLDVLAKLSAALGE